MAYELAEAKHEACLIDLRRSSMMTDKQWWNHIMFTRSVGPQMRIMLDQIRKNASDEEAKQLIMIATKDRETA